MAKYEIINGVGIIPEGIEIIKDNAFKDCSALTSIEIPGSVTNIGDYAFFGCSGLTSIVIPNSVTSIGNGAFSGCTGLTSIVIPNNVTSIGDYAFKGCSALTSIEIPGSVTSIGRKAFFGCSGLTSIEIPSSVTSIGESAFDGCTSLTKLRIEDGDSTLSLGNHTCYNAYDNKGLFYDCPLETLYLGRDLSYENSPFSKTLKSVTISTYVTSIGNGAFSGCSGLTNIKIPSSVTSIGNGAFKGCSGLASIEIPGSVTSIGENAFKGCSGLTSIEIPNSITSIGDEVFNGCTSLKNLCIEDGDSTLSLGNHTCYNAYDNKGLFYDCPLDTLYLGRDLSYKNSPFSKTLKSVTISSCVTSIGNCAFSGCTGLTSIEIPSSVTSIGESAFDGCTSLTKLRIEDGESALSLGCCRKYDGYKGLFYDSPLETLYLGRDLLYSYSPFSKTLKSVTISTSITSIGKSAFSGCTGLECIIVEDGNMVFDSRNNCNAIIKTSTNTLIAGCKNSVIPNSVTSIGNGAFSCCSGLASIEIPGSVTSIGREAFFGCSGLTSIEIPGSVTSFGICVFFGCSGLTSIEIPCSVTSIGNGAFFGCTGLTSIVIPNSVTSIGNYAFEDCSALTSITIPNSVTSIGENAFKGCTGLKEVRISDLAAWYGIKFVNSCANPLLYAKNLYLNGDLLTELVIPDDVTEIKDYAFSGCSGLTSITIPNSVTSIGNGAFYGCTGLTSIEIPNSVTSIGESAFDGCIGLTAVYITDLAAWCNIDFGNGNANPLLYAKNLYLNDELVTEIVIPEGVKEIKKYAFYKCSGLTTNITIPNSVTSIGENAFKGCSGLTSIEIPNSITSIGDEVFNGCTSLKNLRIEDGDSTLSLENHTCYNSYNNKGLFYDCPLETLYLGRDLSYENSPFSKTLKSVTISSCVTSIGNCAFSGCSGLASIEIPGSVTSIGENAFKGCTGLKSIEIPNSVTSIGNDAFFDCTSLKNLCIEDGDSTLSLGNHTCYNSYNNKGLFYDCPLETLYLGRDLSYENSPFSKTLKSVTISSCVTSIGDDVFNGCTSLTKLRIEDGESALSLGCCRKYDGYKGLFYDSPLETLYLGRDLLYSYSPFSKTLKSLTISTCITSIGKSAFEGCSGLTSIVIPNSVTTIGEGAFKDCTKLKTIINFSKLGLIKGSTNDGGIAYYAEKVINTSGIIVGDYIFDNNNGANVLVNYFGDDANLTLPADFNGEEYEIGTEVFKDNTSIVSVVLPDKVTSIKSLAFYNCKNLKKITIPDSIEYIAGDAFLHTAWFENQPDGEIYAGKIFYNYKGTMPPNTSIVIKEGTLAIAGNAFCICWQLRNITIPNTVKSIGDYTFVGCKGLANLILPNSIKHIGENAFRGCTGLESITIPNSVTSIGNWAFCGCSELKSIEIPNSVTVIKYNTFYACEGLKEISIPSSVEIIEPYAFNECSGLTSVFIPSSVRKIGVYAFKGCTSLSKLHIEDHISSLSFGNSLNDCPLAALYLGRDMSYKNSPFNQKTTLTSLTIGSKVKIIANSAFCGCSSLKKLRIEDSDEELLLIYKNYNETENDMFSESPIEELYIGRNLNYNKDNKISPFKNKKTLKSVKIGNCVTCIGEATFENCKKIETVHIGDSIESIGDNAFAGCDNILEIMIDSRKAITANENTFSDDAFNNVCLFVPKGRKFAYEKTVPWSKFYILEK